MMKIKASEAIKKAEKYQGAAMLLQKVYSYLDTPDNMDTLCYSYYLCFNIY